MLLPRLSVIHKRVTAEKTGAVLHPSGDIVWQSITEVELDEGKKRVESRNEERSERLGHGGCSSEILGRKILRPLQRNGHVTKNPACEGGITKKKKTESLWVGVGRNAEATTEISASIYVYKHGLSSFLSIS